VSTLGWYPSGQVESETNVVAGIAVGTSRKWHENGQLAEEREFDGAGDLVSIRRWDEDGYPATEQQVQRSHPPMPPAVISTRAVCTTAA
jgi:antitoxin component YwqK of YwqJK toxin-antitoxin module